MTKIFFTTTLFLLIGVGAVLAHEFWLQPNRFFANVGDKLTIQTMVGEGFSGEQSNGKKEKILQYKHQSATGTADLAPTLTGDVYGTLPVSLTTVGTHLISFSNTPAFLAMRADSFLLYLKEDGLDNVISTRQQQGTASKPSREMYQRCVKTLIQVGDKSDNTFVENTGMPLEIIPAQNPYDQRPGQIATFQVLYGNKPLAKALVRYWNRNGSNPLSQERQRSDGQGRVRFRLRAGNNMVSLVHMTPYVRTDTTKPSPADWHSYWGSLTFGCR
jgi:uncharacterized GH25 family protein